MSASLAADGDTEPRTDCQKENKPKPPKKLHTLTVCMVPPPENTGVWETVSAMRKQLKDPGFYRWPPHANLLYPFLQWTEEGGTQDREGQSDKSQGNDHDKPTKTLQQMVDQIHNATKKCEPFQIRLNSLGTFGGKQRGVLWLFPDSSSPPESHLHQQAPNVPPLLKLHQQLEEGFPMCLDQTKGGAFSPHMTLSHFENLEDALKAQEIIERDYAMGNYAANSDSPHNLEFLLDRIYLLQRKGDQGQFLRVAEIGLGPDSEATVLIPPIAFPAMPPNEEDWVYQERMKLKQRRNGGRGRRGGRHHSRRRSKGPRIPDTTEVIAQKRAERKAKRERLEREQQESQ